jgi:hypothetical protein
MAESSPNQSKSPRKSGKQKSHATEGIRGTITKTRTGRIREEQTGKAARGGRRKRGPKTRKRREAKKASKSTTGGFWGKTSIITSTKSRCTTAA